MSPPVTPSDGDASSLIARFFGVFRYSKEALGLVWTTDKQLTLTLASLTILAGIIPVSYTHLTLPTIYSV